MRNKRFIFALLILLSGCNLMNRSKSAPWSGVYRGVLPCVDCEGIQTEIRLYPDNSFELRRKFLGKSEKIHMSKGKIEWYQQHNQIKLQVEEEKENIPANYQIGENQIIQLDDNGNPISGGFTEKNVLKKAATIR